MTKNIVFSNQNTSSKESIKKMSDNKIKHIPIIDQQKLLGIVSIGDVVNRIIENYAYETLYTRAYID